MFRSHSTLALAVCSMLLCASSHAAIMHDPHQNLNLATDWIEVFVDEFHNGGLAPTTWGTRDGAEGPYANHTSQLSMPFGQLSGRETFWVPRSQPTFYLEGYNPPEPEPFLGDRGLTFHTLDVEALGGADYVTIDPSNVPGRFTYSSTAGVRTVDLPVMNRIPEPGSAVIAMMGVAVVFIRRKRCHSKN